MSLIAGNLRVVQQLLDQSGMAWAVCAGAAAHLYGNRRPIQDVDLLVAQGQLNTIVKLLQSAQKAVQFDGQRIIWRGIKVFDDLTLRQNGMVHPYTLDAAMTERRRRLPLLGNQVQTLAPEDVVIHKLLMGRGAEQGKHDLEDVAGIVRRQQLDGAYIAERVKLANAGRISVQLREFGVELGD
ncbi:MAG: nucleotidyltransferase family protein [Chloroflexaceae bacterium]|jgi:hypothetical protein|nr:nucleotidyltransferase family protein [Chloroflexaceae bacterium]